MLYFLTEKTQKGAYKNMSQAKVDRYKEEKKNRKQTIKKEKRNRVLGRTLGVVIAAAIVCWIGFSGYSYYQEQSVQYRQCHRVTVRKSNQTAEGYYNKDRTPIGSVMLCRWGFCVCRKM